MGKRYEFEGRIGVLQFSRHLDGVSYYWFIPDDRGRRAYVTLEQVRAVAVEYAEEEFPALVM